jgi:hypothetical protein
MKMSLANLAWAAVLAAMLAGCGKEENLKRHIVLYPNSKNFKEEWVIKMLPNGDTLMHGVAKEYFWSGSTKKSVIWKEGKKDGGAQAWYDNGANEWQKSYIGGKREGTWRLFFPDGHAWVIVEYKNDALNGKAQVWAKSDEEKPKEATFQNGSCVSGECGLLDPIKVGEDAPPPEKTAAEKANQTMAEFLE